MKTVLYSCFGWEIARVYLPQGETFSIVVPKDTARDRLSNTTFYTVGRLSAKRDDGDFLVADRTAGFFSKLDLPEVLVRGTTTFTAENECEWWCFDALRNENKNPKITPIILSAGQSTVLQPGSNVLVCQGLAKIDAHTFSSGSAFSVSSDSKELTAETSVFAVNFDSTYTASAQ